ncbi:YadA-like family protein [Acinetobacter chinensis]|uniref:YadA-like family protein n=1 Tax=Acinetobacter chinensis TaxID=2004650 RepID=A0ABU3WDN9_9GAMM|nr:YadA-like family protein [Acinetobacter chinensis]MDV2468515.1 YadA-like family protein [Acinetobacter chinensis]
MNKKYSSLALAICTIMQAGAVKAAITDDVDAPNYVTTPNLTVNGNANINGDSSVSGNSTVNGKLTTSELHVNGAVTGLSQLNGGLTVNDAAGTYNLMSIQDQGNGKGVLYLNGDSYTSGDSTVQGNSTVSGKLTANELHVNGAVTGLSQLNGGLTVNDAAGTYNLMSIQDQGNGKGALYLNGNSHTVGDSLVQGDSTVSGKLTTNELQVNGTITGLSYLNGGLTVNDAAGTANLFSISDQGNGKGALYLNGNSHTVGDSLVQGDSIVSGKLTANELQVNGTITGLTHLNGGLNINDAAGTAQLFSIQDQGNGEGYLQLNGDSVTTGDSTVHGKLTANELQVNGTITGLTHLNGGLNINDATGANNLFLIQDQGNGKGYFQLNGDSVTTGNAWIHGDTSVGGKLTTGDLQVNGTVTGISQLNGNLNIYDATGTTQLFSIYHQNGKGYFQLNGDSVITGNASIYGDTTVGGKLTANELQVNGTITGLTHLDGGLNINNAAGTSNLVSISDQGNGKAHFSVNGDSVTTGNASIYGDTTVGGKLTTTDLQVNGALTGLNQIVSADIKTQAFAVNDPTGAVLFSAQNAGNGQGLFNFNGLSNFNGNLSVSGKVTVQDLEVLGLLQLKNIDAQNTQISNVAAANQGHQAVNLTQMNDTAAQTLADAKAFTTSTATTLRSEAATETTRVNKAIADGDKATLASANKTTADTAAAIRSEAATETTRVNKAIADGDAATLASANKTTADTAAAIRSEAATETTRVNKAIADGDAATLASANKTTADTAAAIRSEAATETTRVNKAIADGDAATLASANKTTADTAAAIRAEAATETTRVNKAITDGDKATLASANKTTADTAAAIRAEAATETTRVNKAITDGDKATLTSANKTTADTATAIRAEIASETTKVNQAISDGDKATLASANKTTADTAAAIRTEAVTETTRVNKAVSDGDKATLAAANKTTADTATALKADAAKETARVNKAITDSEQSAIAAARQHTDQTGASIIAQAKAYTDANANGSVNVQINAADKTAKATAQGADSLAIGVNTLTGGDEAIAIGKNAQALGRQSISIGTGNIVKGNNSGAFGDPNNVTGNASYAFGNNNTISQDNTFVMGNNVNTKAKNAVVLGNGSASDRDNTVSVGASGSERQVINVAAGTASTDAVNVKQMKDADANTLASARSYADSRVVQLNNKLNDIEKTAYRGVAIAMASQQPVPNIKAGQYAVFGGIGHYEGESAGALGVASVFADGQTSISGAFSVAGGGEVGGRVGVSYVFGGK